MAAVGSTSAGPQSALGPVVGFIDMDCFYVAVERRRDPSLIGVPCAVVQYNARQVGGALELPAEANRRVQGSSGGIIAVSYEARQRGVTRQMSSGEARKQCPEVVLIQVPTAFGKADLRIYKSAGDEVVSLLARRAGACEKRSVDEVAIDVTLEAERLLRERSWEEDLLPAARRTCHLADSALSRNAATVSRDDARKGHAGQHAQHEAIKGVAIGDAAGPRDATSGGPAERGGWDWAFFWGEKERRLVAGAVVVAELREAVTSQLGFTCSGGVAQNKMLAKLGCGLHKPNQQTIVLPEAVGPLLKDLPLERLPGLGGDLGQQLKEVLRVSTASELAAVPVDRLESAFPRQAAFLHELAEGRQHDPVQDRELCQSLSAGKTFFGQLCLNTAADCERWLGELAGELHRRYSDDLARHSRAPGRVSVSVGVGGGTGQGMRGSATSASRQMPLELGRTGTVEQIAAAANVCFRRWMPQNGRPLGVTSLGLSLSGFHSLADPGTAPIKSFFAAASTPLPAAPPLLAASEGGAPASPPGGLPVSRKRPRQAANGSPAAGVDGVGRPVAGPLRRLFAASVAKAAAAAANGPGASTTAAPAASGVAIDVEADDVLAELRVADTPGADGLGDIDPAVFSALPPSMQAELLAQLPPPTRAALRAALPPTVRSGEARRPDGGRPLGGIAAFFTAPAKLPGPDAAAHRLTAAGA